LREAWIQPTSFEESDQDLELSLFCLRAAGMVGAILGTGSLETLAEGEWHWRIPLSDFGFWKHFLALGGAFLLLPNRNPAAFGTLVFRPVDSFNLISSLDVQPEIRLRLGSSLISPSFLIGANLGLNYPLSIKRTHYFSIFTELGTLYDQAQMHLHIWGSLGLGYHY